VPVKCTLPGADPFEAYLPRDHPEPPELLGRPGMRAPAALRHGSRRRHVAHGDVPARTRAGAVARRLCAAVAPAEGWPLRRKSQSDAALLPVPGRVEALAAGYPRSLSRIARGAWPRPQAERRSLRRGRLGESDTRCMGPGLGGVAERHG